MDLEDAARSAPVPVAALARPPVVRAAPPRAAMRVVPSARLTAAPGPSDAAHASAVPVVIAAQLALIAIAAVLTASSAGFVEKVRPELLRRAVERPR